MTALIIVPTSTDHILFEKHSSCHVSICAALSNGVDKLLVIGHQDWRPDLEFYHYTLNRVIINGRDVI